MKLKFNGGNIAPQFRVGVVHLDSPSLSPTKRGGGYGKIFGLSVGDCLYLRDMLLVKLFLIGLGMYLLGCLTYGFSRAYNIHILIYFKPLNRPFFRLGLFYERITYQDKEVDTFSIGMFFVNVDIDFERVLDETQSREH